MYLSFRFCSIVSNLLSQNWQCCVLFTRHATKPFGAMVSSPMFYLLV
ncbi:hypothetical protein HMPREF2738_01650 [Clostridiales bacterium KLE1615]|nr:hypothetical protein HMPREF2738_01650 [Clostridiales bacterium KLE1615]